jgi:hypothetical protein
VFVIGHASTNRLLISSAVPVEKNDFLTVSQDDGLQGGTKRIFLAIVKDTNDSTHVGAEGIF